MKYIYPIAALALLISALAAWFWPELNGTSLANAPLSANQRLIKADTNKAQVGITDNFSGSRSLLSPNVNQVLSDEDAIASFKTTLAADPNSEEVVLDQLLQAEERDSAWASAVENNIQNYLMRNRPRYGSRLRIVSSRCGSTLCEISAINSIDASTSDDWQSVSSEMRASTAWDTPLAHVSTVSTRATDGRILHVSYYSRN